MVDSRATVEHLERGGQSYPSPSSVAMNLYRETLMPSGSELGGDLLYMGWNQDQGCFAAGTSNGFIIYNTDPFRETFRRIFSTGGIGIVEMLFRCNLIAIVGGGRNPRYPTNKVMIWDDHQNKCIGELMFRSEVYAVRLRRDRIVVVLHAKVYVYRFSDLKLLDQIATVPNPKGLVALCPEPAHNVLAVPALSKGSIRVELYDISKATIIKAHDSDLACFSLSADGSKIASASDKGTLIRLWDCHTGDGLRELRRGMDRAEIYCIAFDPLTTHLACSSDKGTVHIFSLFGGAAVSGNGSLSGKSDFEGAGVSTMASPPSFPPTSQSNVLPPTPPSSSSSSSSSSSPATTAGDDSVTNKSLSGLSFLRGILPPALVPKYLSSEWSFAQVRGVEGRSICAFDKSCSKIYVVSSDGTFTVCAIEEAPRETGGGKDGGVGGGECVRLQTTKFLRSDDEMARGPQKGLGGDIADSGSGAGGTGAGGGGGGGTS